MTQPFFMRTTFKDSDRTKQMLKLIQTLFGCNKTLQWFYHDPSHSKKAAIWKELLSSEWELTFRLPRGNITMLLYQ